MGEAPVFAFARGLSGATSMVLFFASLNYISLGSAVSLRYVAPIFTAVIAVLFKEKNVPAAMAVSATFIFRRAAGKGI